MTGLGLKEKTAAIGAGFESILLCALVLTNQPAGDPLIGLIAAGGERRMLSGISPALGILANQVTPALERIVLSEQVVRQRGEALFRTLVHDALDVILVLGDDGIVKYASPSATRLFGDIRIDGAKADSLTADFEQVMTRPISGPATSTDARAGPYQITRRDGRRLFVEARFTDRAGHAITLAQRKQMVAAILFIDLDDFKVVNDTMGHAVGDELLTGVAERLAGWPASPTPPPGSAGMSSRC